MKNKTRHVECVGWIIVPLMKKESNFYSPFFFIKKSQKSVEKYKFFILILYEQREIFGVSVNWKGSVYSQATAMYLYWASCISTVAINTWNGAWLWNPLKYTTSVQHA